MSKSNLDRMLENAVAKALGISPPHKVRKAIVASRKPSAQSIRHAA